MMYNLDAYHYQIVWPISPPPTPTYLWDDNDWTNYVRSFKPSDYHGGETDKEAWLDYVDKKNLEHIQKNWPNSIVTLVGRDKFNLAKKVD